jgi:hypothetical protein
MSSPRPSWRPLLAGTIGLFLIIFAFLGGQLRAGGDPALGRSAAQQQTTSDGATGAPPQQRGGTNGFGTDPNADPSAPDSGQSDDGFVPGGSAPAPAVPDGSSPNGSSSSAPTTHQS